MALASRPLGLVELLAQIFVRSGGAGRPPDDGEPGDGPGDGDVTAEMLDARDKESDGLITQAYAALLTAFLIEGQPALRADVVCTLPEGGIATNGVGARAVSRVSRKIWGIHQRGIARVAHPRHTMAQGGN